MRPPLATMLFVPGSEEHKLDKIPSLAPDAFIIDLEDAVAVSAKAAARGKAAAALARHGVSAQIWVRVNAVETGLVHDDVLAVTLAGLAGIVLPKARSAGDVGLLDSLLSVLEHERGLRRGSIELLPTIETANALGRAVEIGTASPRVRCLGFGAGDFSLDLGLEWPPPSGRLSATLVNAKAELVLASRRAGLEAPHDGVFPDFKELDVLRREAEEARELGFGGKHAIHPAQLPVIAEVFAPSDEELARDREIVEAFDESERQGVAAIHIGGRFIDYPVAERARRRLAQAGKSPNSSGVLPLRGIRVLDLSSLYAAPLIATNLGDFGAEVVKVEHPRGDDARRWGLTKDGVPIWWKVISRNKQVIALDLNEEADRDVARRLAATADVVIENFRPGRMESWGLGPEDLQRQNPGLVYVRVTGFGQTGPLSSQPGFGTLAEAFSGFAHITGTSDGPPTLPPFGLADGVAGMVGTYATMIALYWRDARGGEGQVIDLSLYEPLFSILGPQVSEFQQLGVIQERQGNRSPRTAPRNAYRTKDDQWVAISGGTQQVVNRIFAAIGQPDLRDEPRFADAAARRENADEVDTLVADWIAAHPLAEVMARFDAEQAPIAPVYDAAHILDDPQYRARHSIVEVTDPELGQVTMPGIVPRLSKTPGSIRHTGPTAIGADTDTVLADLRGAAPDPEVPDGNA